MQARVTAFLRQRILLTLGFEFVGDSHRHRARSDGKILPDLLSVGGERQTPRIAHIRAVELDAPGVFGGAKRQVVGGVAR